MGTRLILLILFFCTACNSGIIPCPKAKTAKLKKTYRYYSSSLSASAQPAEEDIHQTRSPRNNARMISNVTLEEWDCPRPGAKKYLPKEVKQNIRKNMKKITREKEHEADSARVTNP